MKTILMIIMVMTTTQLYAKRLGVMVTMGPNYVNTAVLKKPQHATQQDSKIGFSEKVSTGFGVNFEKDFPLFSKMSWGSHVGYSTFSEESAGTTLIANIYKISPQLKPHIALTKSIRLNGYMGAGVSIVESKELTRDDSSQGVTVNPNLRVGSGIQVKHVELKVEYNNTIMNSKERFQWTEINVGYNF